MLGPVLAVRCALLPGLLFVVSTVAGCAGEMPRSSAPASVAAPVASAPVASAGAPAAPIGPSAALSAAELQTRATLRSAILEALGPCPAAPADPLPVPDGLVLPPGAVVTVRQVQPDAVQFEGWVPLTPGQVRAFYEGAPGLQLLATEDEVLESETTVDAGDHDAFIKARAVCPTASDLLGVVTPDTGGAPLPVAGTIRP